MTLTPEFLAELEALADKADTQDCGHTETLYRRALLYAKANPAVIKELVREVLAHRADVQWLKEPTSAEELAAFKAAAEETDEREF